MYKVSYSHFKIFICLFVFMSSGQEVLKAGYKIT